MGRRLFDAFLSGPLSSNSVSFFLSGERLFNDESAIVNARTLAGPLIENIPSLGRRARLLGRLEYYLNNNHKLDARYDFNNEVERNRGTGGLNLRSQAIGAAERRHRFQISESAILSSSLINNLRFIFERQEERRGAPATGPAIVVNGAFTDARLRLFGRIGRPLSGSKTSPLTLPAVTRCVLAPKRDRVGLKRAKARTSAAPLNSPVSISLPPQAHLCSASTRASRLYPSPSTRRPASSRMRCSYAQTSTSRWAFATIGNQIPAPATILPRAWPSLTPLEIRRQFCVAGPEFYEHLPESATRRALLFNGARIRELVISNPSFPDPSWLVKLTCRRRAWRVSLMISRRLTCSRPASVWSVSFGAKRK